MRPGLTARELAALLARAARGLTLLVWDGERFHRVTPETARAVLRASEQEEEA